MSVTLLDNMGMRNPPSTGAQDLCEILEERSLGKSTVCTTQLRETTGPRSSRIQDAALEVRITGEGYQGVKARKLASKKKEV